MFFNNLVIIVCKLFDLTFAIVRYVFTWQCSTAETVCLYEPWHDKTNKMSVRPAKTQISLGIHPVWSESSLSEWRKFGFLATHWAHSKVADQTGWLPRLISLRWAHTHFVGFVMSWLSYGYYSVIHVSPIMPYVNNKGTAQPAHPYSLLSTFVVCCLDTV